MPPLLLDPVQVRSFIEKEVNDFIHSGYDHFRQSADRLEGSMKAFCSTPSKTTDEAAKAALADMVLS